MGTTLIFPCSVPDGELYADAARQRGEPVVAASSSRHDPAARKFEQWFFLPSVHDPDFSLRLSEAIARYRIERIFCPVPVANVVLHRLVAEGQISVSIIGEFPIRRHVREHRKLMDEATAHHAFVQDLTERKSPLSVIEVASVLRQSLGIFGESDANKIAAMMAIFADAPRGDVVEIGVLAGRSAYVMASMARRHETGAVLVVDAWSTATAAQRDTAPDFQATLEQWASVVPMEGFFESFLVSLLPIAAPNQFNYLALASSEAHRVWLERRQVTTPQFGQTHYTGTISVLHIDGNHDYENVREDCDLWLPRLAPGGWLVLDDYIWFHGDGPRRVGDTLLTEARVRIERAFVCGKALFLKFGA